MCSNFDFLKGKEIFKPFAAACFEAEKGIIVSPANCAILSRRALELAVKWVYSFDTYLKLPYQDNLSSLIYEPTFRDVVDSDLLPLIKYIIKLGNVSVHTNSQIKREEAVLALHHLHQFVSWIDYCYANEFTAKDFNEELLYRGEEKRTRPEELQDLYEKLSSKDKRLDEIIKENEKLRTELTQRRLEQTEEYDFEVDEISEAETRKRYIDLDLKLMGWEIGVDVIEEVEVVGMPNTAGLGYVDYVLYGNNGKPVAVLEAKRTSVDLNKGIQQAKLYADCLEKQYKQRPIIFLSNGYETWCWDDLNYPSRKVSGIYTKDELQLIIDRRHSIIPMTNIEINDNISNRYYQKEAIMRVCESIEKKHRKMLLVMATGSGKTRTAISIVDVLMRHNYVKNVLFLADRKALVKQAKNNFNTLLPNLTLCNLLDNKENPEHARMIFSTYPTIMNAIDEAKSKEGKKLFTPGHFDLIIVDEAHRSIYKKYQAIFDYFDGILLGLTATPKDEVDKNTYEVFESETGVPTFAYELEQAVKDEYLVDYQVNEIKTKILEEGIRYDDLSAEEKEEFEDTFSEDETVEDQISSTAINEWLFNADTIDNVINLLMEKGIRVEGGDKLGKTIIFAKNSRHAKAIVQRFNQIYPEYGGHYAKVIDYSINYVDTLIDDFSNVKKLPQIAVSVDMLDTGIDIPEVVNLVFFKKVRSKSKFHQMIGRGTRLCKDLFGPGQDKEDFLIFDFCNNFEFFRMNARGFEGKVGQTLTEKIFNTKVEIVKELQELKYQEDNYIEYRNTLLADVLADVEALNEDSFRVRMNIVHVHKYRNQGGWHSLNAKAMQDIRVYIAPLIVPMTDDELAKRFDNLLYTIELAYLQNKNAGRPIKTVVDTAEALSELGTIQQVVEKRDIIEKVKLTEFWESASIFELEEVREELRDLIKLINKITQKIYYTNFADQVVGIEESGPIYGGLDLKNYKKKVEHYLKEHQDELVIYRLRNNKSLTKTDIESLEEILWTKLGTKDEYEREYGTTPVTKLVRKIVGMERQAAREVFSEFISDQSLTVSQLKFVELIIDYIVSNGFVEDNRVLTEDPFRSVGSIIELFDRPVAMQLIGKINQMKQEIEVTA